MTKYAAHDEDCIYAVGKSPMDAIARAKDATRYLLVDTTFYTSPIAEELFAWIEKHGWDIQRTFDYKDGYLIDTTRQSRRKTETPDLIRR